MGSPGLAFKLALLLLMLECHCFEYGDSQKVNLSVYYEAMNPSSASFIVQNLAPIFDNGLNTILKLRLVPLGNAYFNRSSNATLCQNGSDECKLNTLQACAINMLHDVNKHFALIYCFEFMVIEGKHRDWSTCFSSLGLPPKPVFDCLNSINGTKLEQSYANETAQLTPPQAFIPWVIVNNQSIGNDYRNFTFYTCKAYKGAFVPIACQSP